MHSILWHFPSLPALERFVLREGPEEKRLEGTVLTPVDGLPGEIRYEVMCDREWRTRWCSVQIVTEANTRMIELVADGEGGWERNGEQMPDLDGALDVDLGFSPCTNTLAIRRLELEVGESQRLAVAWLRFPGFELVRAEQVYTRLAEDRYRYDSGASDFTAELTVDERGVVRRSGDSWREV